MTTNYKGIDVYKLDTWTQGPAMLQSLNILENFDLKAMGYNSARYIHTVYQAMNLAFADRDFYYGDPDFPPDEPTPGPAVEGVREEPRGDDAHGSQRRHRGPGDPYPFQGGRTRTRSCWRSSDAPQSQRARRSFPRRRTTRSSRASRAAPRPSSRPTRRAGSSR